MNKNLLPPSSTTLEKHLEEVCRSDPEVFHAAFRVGDIKEDIPEEAIPFLVWELGLEPVLPYITDLQRALKEGRQWQKVRGTPEAIKLALGWVGLTAIIEEQPEDIWWDLFQVGLEAPPDDVDVYIPKIMPLIKLSKPAHTDLVRIYGGHDHRRLVINGDGKINGGFHFNDWSGVERDLTEEEADLGLDQITISFRKKDWLSTDFNVDVSDGAANYSNQTGTLKIPGDTFTMNANKINAGVKLNSAKLWQFNFADSILNSSSVKAEGSYPIIGGWPEAPYGDELIQFASISNAPGMIDPS